MSSAVSIPFLSVEEYLRSTFRPDMDYVDGALAERNVGEFDHGDVQSAALEAINAFTLSLGIRARPELRVQISPTRFRVPDVCVLPAAWQRTQIIRQAPLLCIEILSPQDRLADAVQRSRDYLEMGVPEVWVLNPRNRTCTVVSGSRVQDMVQGTMVIPTTSASLPLSSFFRVLDL